MPVRGSDGTTEPAFDTSVSGALPIGEKVADRWHLMEHSSRAFLDTVCQSMRQIRQAVGSTADHNRTHRPRDAQCMEWFKQRLALRAALLRHAGGNAPRAWRFTGNASAKGRKAMPAKWSAHFSLHAAKVQAHARGVIASV